MSEPTELEMEEVMTEIKSIVTIAGELDVWLRKRTKGPAQAVMATKMYIEMATSAYNIAPTPQFDMIIKNMPIKQMIDKLERERNEQPHP